MSGVKVPRWLDPSPIRKIGSLNRQSFWAIIVLAFILLTLFSTSKDRKRPVNLADANELPQLDIQEIKDESDHPVKDISQNLEPGSSPPDLLPESLDDDELEEDNLVQDETSKVVVASIGKGKEAALDWIAEQLPDWQSVLYTYDSKKGLAEIDGPDDEAVAKNRGREANVYLTYIITHYNDLPDFVVFIHGARYQSHNDDPMYDTAPEIKNLRLEYVTKNGYTPLRCNWHDGCQGPGPHTKPKLGHADKFWEVRGLYAKTFQAFFPNETVPTAVSAPCCAQFAVTRDDIMKIPLHRWKAFRRYIYKTHFAQSGVESMKLGLVLEYMWHIIFGKPAVFCGTPAKKCYCEKFGLCDLKCPSKKRCSGRVWRAPRFRLPKGWPSKGQGKKGWPKYGWWNKHN